MSNEKNNDLEQFKKDHPDIPIIDLSNVSEESAVDVISNALEVLEGPKFMNRDRPYNGQPWTDNGIRGSTEVKGLTFRDIKDCFIRAFIISHQYYVHDKVKNQSTLIRQEPNATLCDEAKKGEKAQLNGNDLYTLVGDIDPIALAQNLSCEIEKMMGTFPNIPKIRGKLISEQYQVPNSQNKEHGDKSSY